ncbi:hypothetical protein BN1051_03117 [Arthrobacter saudimassiliensis]|uniref:Activator of Hsp90 ATPase homologue 1/2-like C-terminal domain-containing protein n=1 Tax=Arthrobacter saudimassiliensis TaxID=1461584 RepID=A0A078MTS7_9MICC|nr:hypothetical protein BN1051_03117 [Arthrobacter saudimassiliensis]
MKNPLQLSLPPGEPFADFRREFEAPVSAVFRAHVDPDLYVQWIGPHRLTSRLDGFDAGEGGSFRLVQAGDDGVEFAFRGVFHTIRENEFLLYSFEFEGYDTDEPSLEHTYFASLPGGRSLLSGHSVYPSVESRDQWVAAGMEEGMRQGYDRLEFLLAGPGRSGPPGPG